MQILRDNLTSKFIILAAIAGLTLLSTQIIASSVGINSAILYLVSTFHLILQAILCVLTLLMLVRDYKSARIYACVALTLTILAIAISVFATATPIISRDALIHHLAVPKIWISTNSVAPITWHEWSYYPMLINLAYLALLSLGLEYLAPLYHCTYLLLTAGVIYLILRELRAKPSVLFLGYILTLSTPILLRLGTEPLVDLGLAYYSALALLLSIRLFSYQPRDFKVEAILVGIFLGLALGTKFNAIPFTFTTFLFIILYARRSKVALTRILLVLVLSGVSALIVYSPWMFRSYSSTGNPIYPLFKNIFGPTSQYPGSGVSEFQKRISGFYGESIIDIISTPVRMMISGRDDDPIHFDGLLSPLLLMSLLVFRRKDNPNWLIPLAIATLIFLSISQLYAAPRVRYLAPVIPSLIVLSAFSVQRWDKSCKLWCNTSMILAISLFCFYASTLTFKLYEGFGSSQKRDLYLSKAVPEYPVIQYLNQNLPESSNVYQILTGNRFYLFNVPTRSSGHYPGEFLLWLKQSMGSEKSLLTRFKSEGVTHLLFHSGRIMRLIGDDHESIQAFSSFNRLCTEIIKVSPEEALVADSKSDDAFVLLRLLPECAELLK